MELSGDFEMGKRDFGFALCRTGAGGKAPGADLFKRD
jgi:hypothetical protein